MYTQLFGIRIKTTTLLNFSTCGYYTTTPAGMYLGGSSLHNYYYFLNLKNHNCFTYWY
eukprot:SAG11_NODE_3665_length_2299_cov_8.289868_1_plen_58_part_00